MKTLKIYTLGGGYTDSGWLDCVTLLNGATPYTGQTAEQTVKRQTLDFGRFKLVQIAGGVFIPLANLVINVPFITLPNGLSISGKRDYVKILPAPLATFLKWKLSSDGTTLSIISLKVDSNLTDDSNMWFPIDFTYISQ